MKKQNRRKEKRKKEWKKKDRNLIRYSINLSMKVLRETACQHHCRSRRRRARAGAHWRRCIRLVPCLRFQPRSSNGWKEASLRRIRPGLNHETLAALCCHRTLVGVRWRLGLAVTLVWCLEQMLFVGMFAVFRSWNLIHQETRYFSLLSVCFMRLISCNYNRNIYYINKVGWHWIGQ